MRFTFLTGDVNWREYGGKWVSNKLNNGDWDYWLVLELINMHEATGEEDQPKYNVSLNAVSPTAAGEENLKSALSSMGMEDVTELTDIAKVEALDSYGIHAPIINENGNNAYKLLRQVKKEARFKGEMLFGFSMDGAKNALGSTGWDFISGDIMRPLREYKEQQNK